MFNESMSQLLVILCNEENKFGNHCYRYSNVNNVFHNIFLYDYITSSLLLDKITNIHTFVFFKGSLPVMIYHIRVFKQNVYRYDNVLLFVWRKMIVLFLQHIVWYYLLLIYIWVVIYSWNSLIFVEAQNITVSHLVNICVLRHGSTGGGWGGVLGYYKTGK